MNEQRLSDLLQEYAKPLDGSRVDLRRPVPRRRPRFAIGISLAAGVTALVAVLLLTAPQTATAGAMRRIESAIRNARTMRATTSILQGSRAKARVISRIWYQNRDWRVQGFIGTTIERTTLMHRGQQYVDVSRERTVTAEPIGDWWLPQGMSALEFAKLNTDFGQISTARTMRIEKGGVFEGKPVYRVILDRKEDAYHSEIVVDAKTDLPFISDTQVDDGADHQWSHVDYQFDEPFDASLFDPKAFGKPILDLPSAQARLLAKWTRPSTSDRHAEVVDAAVAPDGTLYLAGLQPNPAGGASSRSPYLPSALNDRQGTRYLHAGDGSPGGVRGDTGTRTRFSLPNRSFVISTWTPLEASAPLPNEIQAKFSDGTTAAVPVRRLQDTYPDYADTLVMKDWFRMQRRGVAKVRADWYRDHGDHVRELECRWAQYRAAADYVPRFGELEIPDLVRCLEALGRTSEAEDVRRKLGKKHTTSSP